MKIELTREDAEILNGLGDVAYRAARESEYELRKDSMNDYLMIHHCRKDFYNDNGVKYLWERELLTPYD